MEKQTEKKYEIKIRRDSGAYAMGSYPYELLYKGKVIATDSNWDSPQYLISLKSRLQKGQKLNWFTKFKAWLLGELKKEVKK